MKKRKLKRFVLPTLYGMVLSIIVISLGLISKLTPVSTNYEYATNGIIDAVMPVFDEEKLITKPVEDNIKIKNDYYSKDDEKNIQQDSLIYYNDTYMPSTGLSYTNDVSFKVYNTMDGTIKSIEKDELLGNVVTIDHGNNILTIYYSVDNIEFKPNEFINAGSIIGDSAKNSLYGDSYALLFEVSVDGKLIDPNTFFEMNPNH